MFLRNRVSFQDAAAAVTAADADDRPMGRGGSLDRDSRDNRESSPSSASVLADSLPALPTALSTSPAPSRP